MKLAAALLGAAMAFTASAANAQHAPTAAQRAPAALPGYVGVLATNDAAGEGAFLRAVVPGSPAARAGLRTGDVVKRVGEALVFNAREMIDELSTYAAGESVTLDVSQDGFTREALLTLGERPEADARAYPQFGRVQTATMETLPAPLGYPAAPLLKDNTPAERRWGLHTIAANSAALARRRLPDRSGALVTRVERDSSADLAGIPQGSLIVEVNETKVDSPAQLASALRAAHDTIEVTYLIGEEERTAVLERAR